MTECRYTIKKNIDYRPLSDKSGLVIFDTLNSNTHIISTFATTTHELDWLSFSDAQFSSWLGSSLQHAQDEIQRLKYLNIIEDFE